MKEAISRLAVRLSVASCILLVPTSSFVFSADWSGFRGENGQGVSDAIGVPVKWSPTENVKWKAALPGPGFSSPIVVGDKVFATCYSGYGVDRENPGDMEDLKRHLVCVNRADGEILWSKTVDATMPEDSFSPPGVTTHGYASHTPTSDGERVYVFFGKSGVLAFDMEGTQLWQTNVGSESDPRAWGSAASPVLYKNLVIVNASAEARSVIALDKLTGEEKWRAEGEGLASTWSTPVLVESGGVTEVVITTPEEIWAINADTGKMRWYAAGSNARGMAATLVVGDGVVYCIGGMMGGASVAVRKGGEGDVTDSHVAWTGRGYAQFGTPVLHDGHLFGADENGIAFCVNAETGEAAFRARLATGEVVSDSEEGAGGMGMRRGGGGMRGGGGGMRGGGGRQGGGRRGGGGMGDRSYGSAVLVGDKVYLTTHTGEIHVIAADPKEFTLLARNQLASDDSGFNATPAVADDSLFIRSNKYLYCVSER
jgi:outer membrane protein assembly factor BamB